MVNLKKRQNGFAPVETVLVLVIVALVAFIAWYAFNTKSNTDSNLDITASTQIAPPQSKSQKSASVPANTTAQIVTAKTRSDGTKYLAGSDGKTLYTYGADTSGVSSCSGSCLSAWPVYQASSTTNLPANVTVITRSDGTKQYAYKGMPLYYYTGDSSAGMVTGDNVSGFHLAKP